MDIQSTFEAAADLIRETLADPSNRWIRVEAAELGLDPRAACRTMYASPEGILVQGETKRLEYYGGFEYEDEYKQSYGEFTFWSAESSRVRTALYSALPMEQAADLREYYNEAADDD